MKFSAKSPCDECPWRKDVAPGRFRPERFDALRDTVGEEDGFRPIFACHKTAEGQETACVGYLMVHGWSNLCVRVAAANGRVNLNELSSPAELYESYEEMAQENGA